MQNHNGFQQAPSCVDVHTAFIGSITDWLLNEFPEGGRIGFDPFVFSLSKNPTPPPPAQLMVNKALTQTRTQRNIDGRLLRLRARQTVDSGVEL